MCGANSLKVFNKSDVEAIAALFRRRTNDLEIIPVSHGCANRTPAAKTIRFALVRWIPVDLLPWLLKSSDFRKLRNLWPLWGAWPNINQLPIMFKSRRTTKESDIDRKSLPLLLINCILLALHFFCCRERIALSIHRKVASKSSQAWS